MVVGLKDTAKLFGISVIACCAVMVCTMFLNFYLDIRLIEDAISTPPELIYYTAQTATAKVVCYVTGGCLSVTSVIMLLFYVKHYIDTHKRELGILKALGYSNLEISLHFWVFGISILAGTALGYGGGFLLMPRFYELQNKDHILPQINIHFHPVLFLCLVFLPAIAFAVLAIFYAACRLKRPVMALLKNSGEAPRTRHRHHRGRNSMENMSFLRNLKKSTLQSRKSLVFFIAFASFCFSSMTQMSASMEDLSSAMMGIMILGIGILLSCTTLFLSITTVVRGNARTIAMMRLFGYTRMECCRALLSCYRPVSYLGFVLGSIYQYGLLRIMVDIVFRDFEGVPAYHFDFPAMFLSLGFFLTLYELAMYYYSRKIKDISVKEIMTEL